MLWADGRCPFYSFPLWGKAGMGALRDGRAGEKTMMPIFSGRRAGSLLRKPPLAWLAPIPTFPQKGKESYQHGDAGPWLI